jgi:hypothetical protein
MYSMVPCRRLILGLVFLAGPAAFAKCIPIEEAPKKVGDETCVRGTVIAVKESKSGGAWFLNYCADYTKCPFTVVIFAKDLRDVGDVRMLAGKSIEVFGKIRLYNDRAEIILRNARQLYGEAAKLPPPPKTYDASRKARHSAGKFKSAKQGRRQKDPPPTTLKPDKPPPAGEGDSE